MHRLLNLPIFRYRYKTKTQQKLYKAAKAYNKLLSGFARSHGNNPL